jgi:hypothetical protein
MPVLDISLSADQLAARMQDRLRGLNAASPNTVLWRQGSAAVLIFVDSLKVRLLTGWLMCNLDLQSDTAGRQTLQFIFYLGSPGLGDGPRAGASINAATAQAAQLADAWGATVQRVLWDAVLDALEAFLAQAATQNPGQPLAIQGFQTAPGSLSAAIVAGDK